MRDVSSSLQDDKAAAFCRRCQNWLFLAFCLFPSSCLFYSAQLRTPDAAKSPLKKAKEENWPFGKRKLHDTALAACAHFCANSPPKLSYFKFPHAHCMELKEWGLRISLCYIPVPFKGLVRHGVSRERFD